MVVRSTAMGWNSWTAGQQLQEGVSLANPRLGHRCSFVSWAKGVRPSRTLGLAPLLLLAHPGHKQGVMLSWEITGVHGRECAMLGGQDPSSTSNAFFSPTFGLCRKGNFKI